MAESQGRSTAELINELRAECSGDVRAAALVVGFERHTKYVWASDEKALETLNDYVKSGGEPVGIIAVRQNDETARPLAEYQDQEWVEKYLTTLNAKFQQATAQRGIRSNISTEGFV